MVKYVYAVSVYMLDKDEVRLLKVYETREDAERAIYEHSRTHGESNKNFYRIEKFKA